METVTFGRDASGKLKMDRATVAEFAAQVRKKYGAGTLISASIGAAADDEVTRLVQDYRDQHPTVDLDTAVAAVARREKDLFLLSRCPRTEPILADVKVEIAR